MSTFLFDKIIFGPVKSRRLGVSLGVNLLPVDRKVCNFDCIYCECGWTEKSKGGRVVLPTRKEFADALQAKLSDMMSANELPDVITFAGNGEPTMHPEFEKIIDDTILLRDAFCPAARIAVLSNSTLIHKPSISRSLQKVDQNILKLDTVSEETFRRINKPAGGVSLKRIVENLEAFRGRMILQTLFLRGETEGVKVDNTTEIELSGLIEAYHRISPEKIMIYTFERDTAAQGLQKVSLEELNVIKYRLEKEGFSVEVSA